MLSEIRNSTIDAKHFLEIYNLSAYIVIMVVGLIWNGTLLLMFARHKEIRTTANTMIFNLAVCDFINLSIVAPLRYRFHYPHIFPYNVDLCRSICVFQHWLLSASALSVVALSIQRFCITVPYFMFHMQSITIKTPLLTTVYILVIWIISLLVALPFGVIWNIYAYLCGDFDDNHDINLMIMADFIYYCLLLPFILFFFNLATARRLKKSIRNFVGGVNSSTREVVRKRGANVVTVLSILFVVTHLPYFSWCLCTYWFNTNRNTITMLIFEFAAKHFLFLNNCFNPVALYITSSTFRTLFRRYLCFCKQQRDGSSSIQNTSSSNLRQ